ncbi:phage tail tube protein [Azorhizobium doebereinerae]|uniref:phage tail tube protein n=1 Tax=Azorhizobium doebereinerae TaxID=281091 RepID=UPI0003FBFA4B|nr:phage tail tube protein [Azorhizobium doebereinerae]
MALQSTNRVRVGRVRETTYGVVPTSPVFKAQRLTSNALAGNPQTTVSNEIRSDRQVTDLILTGVQAGGNQAGELSFSAADDDFEEALQGTWLNKPSVTVLTADTEISDVSATTLTVASGGAAFKAGHICLLSGFPTPANNKLARVASATATSVVFPASTFLPETAPIPVGAVLRSVGFEGASGDIVATVTGGNALTSTVLDFTTLGLNKGEWVKIGGGSAAASFATAANNGWARVSDISANRLSLGIVPSGWSADTGTGKALQVFAGDFLTNGTNLISSAFERQYLDHSPVTYEYLTGQCIDQLSMSVQQQAIVTYEVTWLGSNATTATTRASGASDLAAPAKQVLNASADVGRIAFDGSAITGPNYVMSANFSINNNLRRQNAVGSIAAIGVGNGEFSVTGTLETYFGDASILAKIMGNSLTSFDLRVGRTDGGKEKLAFDFPAIKLSSGSPSVSGKNADVTISAGFQAIMDPVLGYTMSVGRLWYTP